MNEVNDSDAAMAIMGLRTNATNDEDDDVPTHMVKRWDDIILGLKTYRGEAGNDDFIPQAYIIPSTSEWPVHLHGVKLGRLLDRARTAYHHNQLTAAQIEILNQYKLHWDYISYRLDPQTSTNHSGYKERNLHAFTPQDDDDLRQVLWTLGSKFSSNMGSPSNSETAWTTVAAHMAIISDKVRSPLACRGRWLELQNEGNAVKTGWLSTEDAALKAIVTKHKAGNWRLIACHISGRTFKQCRERWHNHLDPEIKKGHWTVEESALVMDKQRLYGNKWARIASYLDGRTDNMVKNHWHCSLLPRLNAAANGVVKKGRAFKSIGFNKMRHLRPKQEGCDA